MSIQVAGSGALLALPSPLERWNLLSERVVKAMRLFPPFFSIEIAAATSARSTIQREKLNIPGRSQ